MGQYNLYLFGSPRLEQERQPVEIALRKGQALLAYLALTTNPQSRDALATLFWPESGQRNARASLRRLLYEISQRVGDNLLAVEPEMVSVEPSAHLWLDVAEFNRLATVAAGETDELSNLEAAVALYTDDFMAGFTLEDCPAFDDWQFFAREELRQTFDQVLVRLSEILEGTREYVRALPYARRRVALDPLNESSHCRLMWLYAMADKHAAALRQYQECVRILDEELGVPLAEETRQLFEDIRLRKILANRANQSEEQVRVDQDTGPLETFTVPEQGEESHVVPHNLPVSATPFVGREQELAEVTARLSDPNCRLLTLVGPGGIGKTRLVLAIGERTVGTMGESVARNAESSGGLSFGDGLFFVGLQPVMSTRDIPAAIAESIGFRFAGNESTWNQLLDYLGTKEMLLILDNFEHLLEGVALVEEMLVRSPAIKLLITSRESLNLREEWFHPVSGMRFTPSSKLNESITEGNVQFMHDAARMFVQLSKQVRVDFDLGANLGHIDRICRMVDGMPLAIELAATWQKVLSLAEIETELENGFSILTGTERNLPERHRSMQVVLEQSWAMLTQAEQEALMGLSIFHGGFDRTAARAVANASYPLLASLIAKSFVKTDADRFQIHELLRQFGESQLAGDQGRAQEAHCRHCEYYLAFVSARREMLNSSEHDRAKLEVGIDIDNILSAWSYGIKCRMDELLIDSIQPLFEYYIVSGLYVEGREIVTDALSIVGQSDTESEYPLTQELRSRLHVFAADFASVLGDYQSASRDIELALNLSSEPMIHARAYVLLAHLQMTQGDRTAAEESIERSSRIYQQLDDRGGIYECMLALNLFSVSYGEFVRARTLGFDVLAIARQIGRPDYVLNAMGILAWPTNCLGLYDESEAYWREILEKNTARRDKHGIGRALNFLGWEAWSQGAQRLQEARQYHEEALIILNQLGGRPHLAMAYADYGLVTNELGDYATTMQACTRGFELARAINSPMYVAYNLTSRGFARAMTGQLEEGRREVLRGVRLNYKNNLIPQTLISLYHYAHLLVYDGGEAEIEEGCFLLCLVASHPLTWQPVRDRAERSQAELAGCAGMAEEGLLTNVNWEERLADVLDKISKRELG